ncbi:MAG TPA: tetratricopeptide repeat protein [Flavobacterium sp.]|jgi:hypothetical protein
MKKLYVGVVSGILIFGFFLISQMNFAQNNIIPDTTVNPSNSKSRVEREQIRDLELRINDLERNIAHSQKYIDASQKNLDLWLKYLAFTLSILIGYSIFNGLKSREMAKDELREVKDLKSDIKTLATDAEARLKAIGVKLSEIENTAIKAKDIEDKMAEQLKDFSDKADLALDAKQEKKLDKLIEETKIELQNNGIEAFKNLYFAKALKTVNNKDDSETIRLITNYIDLDETHARAYYIRGKAYLSLFRQDKNNQALVDASIADYDEAIRLNVNYWQAFNNRGNALYWRGDYENAISDYTNAIRLKSEYALGYFNRSLAYKELGDMKKSTDDLEKAKELGYEVKSDN